MEWVALINLPSFGFFIYVFPDTDQAIRKRVSSYRSALNKEQAKFGGYRDGGGKRYLLFWLLFVLNDLNKMKAHIAWFESAFPDDAGEPIAQLCWAIALYRQGDEPRARYKLAESMLNNLYVIPKILGKRASRNTMWHSSNWSELSYVEEIPDTVSGSICENEKVWIRAHYNSFEFRRIRERHIQIYALLEQTNELESREKLVNEASQLLTSLDISIRK